MVQIFGFVLALIAGLTIRDPRRATLWLIPPWLAVLGVQTWSIASGRGHSSAATAGHVSYWVFQVISLAVVVGLVAMLARQRQGAASKAAALYVGRLIPATMAAVVASAGLSLLYVVASEPAHPGQGATPPIVAIGLLASVTTLIGAAIRGRIGRRFNQSSKELA